MSGSSLTIIGNQQIAPYGLPDSIRRHKTGTLVTYVDPCWGGGEVVYLYATSAIRQGGLIRILPTLQTSPTDFRWEGSEVANTANLGYSVAVAMVSAATGNYFWAMRMGVVPLNCNASVAADTTFGIAAAGQGGANSAGKQILNARVIAPATTTITKPNAFANSGSVRLQVNGVEGLFAGVFLSGTGIAAGTTVVDVDPSGNFVTLSAATTAQVNGTVTATYNNGTVFYNIVHVDRPLAQGAIT